MIYIWKIINMFFFLFINYVSRYSGPPGQQQRFNSPTRGDYQKRFDDVAPPGTEGYYDVPPPGVDHPERLLRDERERPRSVQEDRDHKDADDDRPSRDDRQVFFSFYNYKINQDLINYLEGGCLMLFNL